MAVASEKSLSHEYPWHGLKLNIDYNMHAGHAKAKYYCTDKARYGRKSHPCNSDMEQAGILGAGAAH